MDNNVYSGLPQDWAYSPSIDLELKQYTLLGFLQRVKARFAERKLYPYLGHVQEHVQTLHQLQHSKTQLGGQLGGTLLGFDPRTGAAVHERPQEDDLLKVIDEVIAFAVPGLVGVQAQGLELQEQFAQRIQFGAVGLQPLHTNEGWLFLRLNAETKVYSYNFPRVMGQGSRLFHQNLLTRYVTTYSVGVANTYERIKADLVRRFPMWPNPATFVAEAEINLPCIETFVPLAKQKVYAHLATTA
jgi:hypothetical protein